LLIVADVIKDDTNYVKVTNYSCRHFPSFTHYQFARNAAHIYAIEISLLWHREV